jgi:hypothetical protein
MRLVCRLGEVYGRSKYNQLEEEDGESHEEVSGDRFLDKG